LSSVERRKRIDIFLETIALTIAALLPIMNPFSTAPLFVSLTANFQPKRQRQQAFLACIYAFGILAVFLVLGSAIVDFFSISVPGIRVAGGLIISSVGFRMLFPSPSGPHQNTNAGSVGHKSHSLNRLTPHTAHRLPVRAQMLGIPYRPLASCPRRGETIGVVFTKL
jgi:hypothetical protein